MSDLIRRSAVIDAIRGEREYLIARKQLNAEHVLAHHFDAIMDSIPAVDAVEVVRCRECRHYKPSKYNASTAHYCGVIDGFPKEDWFCADGQRREDGDNGKHL